MQSLHLQDCPCKNGVFWMHPAEMCQFLLLTVEARFFHCGTSRSTWNRSVMKATMILCKCVRRRDAVGGMLGDTMSYSVRQQRSLVSCMFYSPAFHSCCWISHDRQEPLIARGGYRTVRLKADSHIACRAHAVPLPCRTVHSHMPCRAHSLLRQCRVLREIPRGSRKYPNC
jgi:hypothetical protein